MAQEFKYKLRIPIASSIHHEPTHDETYSILKEVNASRSASQRLPEEIILRINDDIHANFVYECIRSPWIPITNSEESDVVSWDSMLSYTVEPLLGEIVPLGRARLDCNTKRYSLGDPWDEMSRKFESGEITDIDEELSAYMESFYAHISAPDLLYRLRCFFPEVHIASEGPARAKVVWSAGIRHKETGIGLGFSEWKGEALLRVDLPDTSGSRWRIAIIQPEGKELLDRMKKDGMAFSIDAMQLLNAFFETIDGKRLAYFHPAAEADLPAENECYPVIAGVGSHSAWKVTSVAPIDLTSFKSLLPSIKYNPKSRQVDIVNGTINLSTIVSSSTLFYRILCQHRLKFPSNVNTVAPITSIWQVKFIHYRTGTPLILMDHRGLVDIRAGDGVEEIMEDIVALVVFFLGDGSE